MQNRYLDKRSIFMEPEVNQYGGSHMVMTNVMKDVKKKYVNIDTRFCKDYSDSTREDYYIDFPERIQNVRNISVNSVEFPSSYYNFSKILENTAFIIDISTNTTKTTYSFDIDNGFYSNTGNNIYDAINNAISKQTLDNITLNFSANADNYHTDINVSRSDTDIDTTVKIYFAAKVGSNQCNTIPSSLEKNLIQTRLGWALGFRKPIYICKNETVVTSEAFLDLYGSRYLFLAIDEFNNSAPQSSFISMLPKSLINKNIIARINNPYYSESINIQIVTSSIYNGYLCSDTRQYSDDIDIQKMHIQLLDEFGRVVSLNGLNFSFLLEVEHT